MSHSVPVWQVLYVLGSQRSCWARSARRPEGTRPLSGHTRSPTRLEMGAPKWTLKSPNRTTWQPLRNLTTFAASSVHHDSLSAAVAIGACTATNRSCRPRRLKRTISTRGSAKSTRRSANCIRIEPTPSSEKWKLLVKPELYTMVAHLISTRT